MKTGVRANLDAQSISTIPKKDVRRGVLEYLQNQQQFMKAYAKEGIAYALSWKEGAGSDPATPAIGTNQSCGFTTPVLKHRTRPALKEKLQVNLERHKEVPASPKGIGISKPTDRTANLKKRGPQRQEARGSKRKRPPQSEEEKRLQERREKKRIKRDIMQSERPKRQEDTDSPLKPHPKKTKQKLPAGLALMHGFTATNVGKNRLTVDPPLRLGVFNKGKASFQAQVGRSRSKDSRANRAFSEEQFLKSNGRHRSNSIHTCSSVALPSEVSSETTENLEHLRRNLETETGLSDSPSACKAKRFKSTKHWQEVCQKSQRARTKSSRQSSEKARSIVWDIEKDGGVLPSDSSSVQGLKPSTVLLDVAPKKWTTENKQDPPLNEGESLNNLNEAEHASDPIVSRRPSSVASSVGPSKSASQIGPALDNDSRNPEEGVSKYFMLPRPPTIGSLDTLEHKSECSPPNPSDKRLISLVEAEAVALSAQSSDGPQQSSIFVEPEEPTRLISLVDQDNAPHPRDITDSDWLLSDSIPDDPSFGHKGAWVTAAESSEAQCANDLDLPGDVDFCQLQEPSIYGDYLPLEKAQEEYYDYFGNDFVALRQENNFFQNQLSLNDGTENNGTDDLPEDGTLISDTSPESLAPSEFDCASDRFAEESTLLFNEGRYLLLGRQNGPTLAHVPQSDLKAVEADVAQHLVSHWMPQRY